MPAVSFFLLAALIGVAVGALARPAGSDLVESGATMAAGLAGALAAAGVARGALGREGGGGLVLSLLGAGLVVWLLRRSGRVGA